LFGDLGDDPDFVAELEDALVRIERHGAHGALAAAVADAAPVPA
jgi:hypothetical protein